MSDLLTFWQEVIKAAVGPLLTALLATIVGGMLVSRWTKGREEKKEQFEVRTRLLAEESRVVTSFYMLCQHVSRVKSQAGFAPAGSWDSELDAGYRQFWVDCSILENGTGARFGFEFSQRVNNRNWGRMPCCTNCTIY